MSDKPKFAVGQSVYDSKEMGLTTITSIETKEARVKTSCERIWFNYYYFKELEWDTVRNRWNVTR